MQNKNKNKTNKTNQSRNNSEPSNYKSNPFPKFHLYHITTPIKEKKKHNLIEEEITTQKHIKEK